MAPPTVALVTGATGFLGRHLVKHLLGEGAQVRALTSGTTPQRLGIAGHDVSWFGLDESSIEVASKGVTQFFNLAVIYDRPAYSVAQIDAVNVELPLRVMAALARNGDPVACVMGDSFYRKYPTDTTAQPRYTESKLRLADRLRSRGTSGPCRVAMLLIEQVYGPGENLQKAYPRVVRQMLENVRRVSLTHGIQKRDFIDVDDVIQALLLAARSDFSGFVETGCGSGTSTMVRDVFERLRDLTDSSSELGFGDIPPDQSIPDSTANTEWLRQRGWACRVPLVDGLRKFVHDIAQRSQEKAASS